MAEHITLMEASSRVWSLCHLSRSRANFGLTFLLLGDNVGVVAAGSNGRARYFALLKHIRRAAAFLLASDIVVSDRWIESSRNAADAPSRWFMSSNRVVWLRYLRGGWRLYDERFEQPF